MREQHDAGERKQRKGAIAGGGHRRSIAAGALDAKRRRRETRAPGGKETDSVVDAVELIARLEQDARRIVRAFGLRYRTIEPERPHVRRRLGVCYADGTIRIRLFHARTGAPLKYSSLVDTLCHELAHLRHFNHGRRFQALYRRILEHARRAGIYRPGPEHQTPAAPPLPDRVTARAPRAARQPPRALPEQLALF